MIVNRTVTMDTSRELLYILSPAKGHTRKYIHYKHIHAGPACMYTHTHTYVLTALNIYKRYTCSYAHVHMYIIYMYTYTYVHRRLVSNEVICKVLWDPGSPSYTSKSQSWTANCCEEQNPSCSQHHHHRSPFHTYLQSHSL